jgi:gamma-glutamyl phosphate reductase
MNWQDIVFPALSAIATALGTWLVALLTKWINDKIKDKDAAKMLTDILNIIYDAVKAVYQTFVESLKKDGKFTAEAQEEAKNKALAIINSKLTDTMKTYITDNYGDVNTFISQKIEAAIYDLKNKEAK